MMSFVVWGFLLAWPHTLQTPWEHSPQIKVLSSPEETFCQVTVNFVIVCLAMDAVFIDNFYNLICRSSITEIIGPYLCNKGYNLKREETKHMTHFQCTSHRHSICILQASKVIQRHEQHTQSLRLCESQH